MTRPTFYESPGTGPFSALERGLGSKPAAAAGGGRAKTNSVRKNSGKRASQCGAGKRG